MMRTSLRVDTVREDMRRLVEAPADARVRDAVEACDGGWAIDAHFGRVLANAVTRLGRRSILEFGAGTSSVLLARVLDAVGGGCLTSIEQDPSWCAEQWQTVRALGSVKAALVTSVPVTRVGRLGAYAYHAQAEVPVQRRAPYDLVVVDSPQYYLGREGAMPLVCALIAPGGLVMLDDAARGEERWTLWKWLQTYPGLTLEYYDADFGNTGLAILRKQHGEAPRFSPLAFAVGVRHGYLRWRSRHRTAATPQ